MASRRRCGNSIVVWAGCVAVWLSLVRASTAAEPVPPRITLPRMPVAPSIDGRIIEGEWQHAVRNAGFVSHQHRRLASREGIFWIGGDADNLYLAIRSEAPPDSRILNRAVPDADRDQPAAFLDDSIELVLDPRRGRSQGNRTFYHVITNGRGALYDWSVDPDNAAIPKDLNWRLADWQLAQQLIDGWWHVEIAIPLTSLGVTPEDFAAAWGLRVARNWQRPAEQSQWSGGSPDYDHQATMPEIRWDDTAPVVRVMRLHEDHSSPRIEVAIFNPHDTPVELDVFLSDAWHRDPPQELRRRVTVDPHQQQLLALTSRDGGPEGVHRSEIRVTSLDGRDTFYQRVFDWSLRCDDKRWTIGDEQQRAVDLQFKFYPYLGKIRFRAGIRALAVRDRVSGAVAQIVRMDGGEQASAEPLWRQPVTFVDDVAEAIHEIPDLPDGEYQFQLILKGGDGVPRDPISQPFARRVFPWEHNDLGISDEVMPPFDPLEVDGARVDAVLREHHHGDTGLWEQVISDGRSLLAGPIVWEVTAAGETDSGDAWPVVGEGWKSTEAKATEVTGRCAWSAGPLRAEMVTRYDYDGMMLVTLDLHPTDEPVGRLSLTIPLRDDIARYMHAIGDGLRHNYAGRVPEGTGRIWDSGQASRLEIPGTFFPYLWIGDGARGICWFADTDRDWILDEQTPTIDLTRAGDGLNMRVHFVTRPQKLDRTHRIVFGLQATPTKPMPEGWRRWTGIKSLPGARPVRWVGATFYWGGLSYDVYPYQYRFEYFDKLREARESGEIDREFVARWLDMVDREIAAKGSERYKFFEAHVNAGFHAARTSTWQDGFRLFGYTNPRGVGFHVPEFATFQDEWLRYGWFNRNWGPGESVGYDVSPSRSFQDYALWYYREMLRCFDGVYWDNMFLSANFDPVVGQSWIDEKGRVHPSLGLMHLRQLAKRTAVMLWQETRGLPGNRRPPITLSHMTNTLIVPVHSFLNCTMDWEWKYGYEDFQDRFSPDLTVAETIGRQVGAWPTILAGGHPDASDPRVDFLYRTRLGVALVHEIQVFDYQPRRDTDLYARLFEFGYGTPECRVFNYWNDGYPVRVDGVNARSLAMAHAGQALIVVTDYGDGGKTQVVLDLSKLGLESSVQATDFETGEPISNKAPGVFEIELKKHDFRIMRVQ